MVDVFLVGVVASEPVIEAVNPVNVFVFVVPVREGVLYPLASDCEREWEPGAHRESLDIEVGGRGPVIDDPVLLLVGDDGRELYEYSELPYPVVVPMPLVVVP